MHTVDDCEGQFICWRLGLIEWDVLRSEITVGNLVKFKSKSLLGGMTSCSSRDVQMVASACTGKIIGVLVGQYVQKAKGTQACSAS